MKNKHRRQGRVKVSTLHGGRDRNSLVVARAQRATVFERIKDSLLAEAEMLVLQKKGAFSITQIAHMAVEQFLSRGGSEIAMGGNHKGFIIDDETKSWWAAKVEESIGPLGRAAGKISQIPNEVPFDMTIQAGQYEGQAIPGKVRYGETPNRSLQIAIDMEIFDQKNQSLGQMTTFLYFTKGTEAYSYERLRALGWKGTGPKDIDRLGDIYSTRVPVRVTAPEPYTDPATKQTKMGTSKLEILAGAGTVAFQKSDVARAALEETQAQLAGAKSHFSDVSGLDYDDVVRILVEVTQVVVMPPLTSANNVEVAAMGMAHLIGRLPRAKHLDDVPRFPLVKAYREHPKLVKMIQFHADLMEHVGEDPESIPFNSFLLAWARSAYARLEIGHKIAASFCLTDVPDGFVEAPWEAWSLVVPDGLLDDVARVWSVGLEPMLALNRGGRRRKLTRVESDMVKCLVRSSALALANPDEFKKRRDHGSVSRSAKGRHEGPPDLAQARYMISAPVEVDLRENVAAALEDERLGRKHASPKVQFLVRGHPRMQVHGEGRALRKKIWVQPFWKGPAEGRILLRPHRIDSGKEQ